MKQNELYKPGKAIKALFKHSATCGHPILGCTDINTDMGIRHNGNNEAEWKTGFANVLIMEDLRNNGGGEGSFFRLRNLLPLPPETFDFQGFPVLLLL